MSSSNMHKRGGSRLVIPSNVKHNMPNQREHWAKIRNAIYHIFQRNASSLSFQSLYQASYQLVLQKHGQYLFENVKSTLVEHISGVRHQILTTVDGSFLPELIHQWERHRTAVGLVRDILMYLDRAFVTKLYKVTLYDVGTRLFGQEVFHRETLERIQRLIMLNIRRERDGEEIADNFLLHSLTSMMIEISKKDIYIPHFERRLLQESEDYFTREAMNFFEASTATDYLRKVIKRLKEENDRCIRSMDPGTRPKLETLIKRTMIDRYKEHIIEKEGSGCEIMLQNWKFDELRLVYDVLGLVQGALDPLIAKVYSFATKEGMNIVKDKEMDGKPLEMVKQIIDLQKRFQDLLTQSFSKRKANEVHRDPKFAESIRNAFDNIVNAYDRLPEYISLYVDSKLKKGKNQIAESDFDILFEQVVALFRHLHDKDLFEKYYKIHLARRLLNDKSQSDDAEKSFITKLKTEFGYQFTAKMEGMFNDMKISRENHEPYKNYVASQAESIPIDLSIQVLTTGYWPVTTSPSIATPAVLAKACHSFESFYLDKHTGRRLTWQFNMGNAEIRANGFVKKYELNVSTYQACILLLFNDAKELTYADILETTKIPPLDLKKNLHSLSLKGKNHERVLTKSGEAKSYARDTMFSPNSEFSSKLLRTKVAPIVVKESKEQSRETIVKVDEERNFTIDAAIVRVMKMRKTLAHRDLVIEVTKQLQHRFMVDPQMLKKRIESLIERDYLERDAENRNTYHYLA